MSIHLDGDIGTGEEISTLPSPLISKKDPNYSKAFPLMEGFFCLILKQ
jgi:hypothetical protein